MIRLSSMGDCLYDGRLGGRTRMDIKYFFQKKLEVLKEFYSA